MERDVAAARRHGVRGFLVVGEKIEQQANLVADLAALGLALPITPSRP